MLVAVTGLKQSGKDSIANILVAEHGFTKLSFADPIKEMALGLDPIVGVDAFGEGFHLERRLSEVVESYGWDYAKEEFPEVRRILQRLGVEAGRKTFGDDVWIDLWSRKAELYENVVVPDCRFLNEAAFVRSLGGSIWKVVRDGQVSTDSHSSETEMAGIEADYIIRNRGESLDALGDLVHEVMDREWHVNRIATLAGANLARRA